MESNVFRCNIKCTLYLFLVYCLEGSYGIVFGCSSFTIFLLCGTENNRKQYKVNMLHYTSGRMSSKTQVFYLLSLLQLVSGAKRTYISAVIFLHMNKMFMVLHLVFQSFFVYIYKYFPDLITCNEVTYFALTKNKGTRCRKKKKI